MTLKDILDLTQYTEESILLYDKEDNQLLSLRLFVDKEFCVYYKYKVIAIEAIDTGFIKISINI